MLKLLNSGVLAMVLAVTHSVSAADRPYGPGPAKSVIETKVEYKDGDALLEGSIFQDITQKGTRPGVIVVHDWMGPGEYARLRASQLARLGYVAFVADIYGTGIRPKDPKEAGAAAGSFKKDRTLLRKRVNLALQELLKAEFVDKNKIAAIGYCFGGTTVLELARSGAKINGVVSFHGGLDTPTAGDAKHIQAKVLVLTGADDPSVPPEQVDAFEKEMKDGKVDWQLVSYSNAVHSFSNPGAGNDPSKGNAYHAPTDKRSFIAMEQFFKEIF